MNLIVLETTFDADDLITLKVKFGDVELRLFAGVVLDGRELTLQGLHVEGPGANAVGISLLRAVVARIAEIADVETVIVEGAIRTTGAGPGRRPKPACYRRPARSGPA